MVADDLKDNPWKSELRLDGQDSLHFPFDLAELSIVAFDRFRDKYENIDVWPGKVHSPYMKDLPLLFYPFWSLLSAAIILPHGTSLFLVRLHEFSDRLNGIDLLSLYSNTEFMFAEKINGLDKRKANFCTTLWSKRLLMLFLLHTYE